jgi:hypothetical protein
MEGDEVGVVILAGTPGAARQIRWKRRISLFRRIFDPRMWGGDRRLLETRIASVMNRDDYIWGENKPLLYLHPDLISQKNIRYFKRIETFARRSGERIYPRQKREMMRYLAREGITPLHLVIDSLVGSERIDSEKIVVVGPKIPIKKELEGFGNKDIKVARQGISIGENILIGKNNLDRMGYDKEYFLVIGADVPLADSNHIDDFIERAVERGGDADLYFGMGSRDELRKYIREVGVEHLGKVGPNHPKKGYLNKFGIPMIDDIGEFSEKGKKQELVVGNLFLYRTRSVNREFIDHLYSMRKMFANPFHYYRLITEFGRVFVKALLVKLSISDGEYEFNLQTGIEMMIVRVAPPMTLDIDSYSDLRRACAIKLKQSGKDRDLEFDFREYVRKKRKRKRSNPETTDVRR